MPFQNAVPPPNSQKEVTGFQINGMARTGPSLGDLFRLTHLDVSIRGFIKDAVYVPLFATTCRNFLGLQELQ
jgi:hypothetical protein